MKKLVFLSLSIFCVSNLNAQMSPVEETKQEFLATGTDKKKSHEQATMHHYFNKQEKEKMKNGKKKMKKAAIVY